MPVKLNIYFFLIIKEHFIYDLYPDCEMEVLLSLGNILNTQNLSCTIRAFSFMTCLKLLFYTLQLCNPKWLLTARSPRILLTGIKLPLYT